MAQPATSPKIDELRARLRAEPNSRIFYPLAEELRKAGQHAEAEQVLRSGLANHQTYLAAWVSLGRVLRDQKRAGEAIEPLVRAMQLDPENLVAARLLGDCYLDIGEKVEAIKKYKLVQALMPGDEDLELTISQLDHQINPPVISEEQRARALDEAEASLLDSTRAAVPVPEPSREAVAPSSDVTDAVFEAGLPLEPAAEAMAAEQQVETSTADVEPMLAAHDTSPFEEPVAGYSAAALELEAPAGFSVERAPLVAEVSSPVAEDAASSAALEAAADSDSRSANVDPFAPGNAEAGVPVAAAASAPFDDADVFAPSHEPFDGDETASFRPREELTNTITMADLYVRQGLVDDARQIYESILLRDPGNAGVRSRLEALGQTDARPAPPDGEEPDAQRQKIERLQQWLGKVSRKGVERV